MTRPAENQQTVEAALADLGAARNAIAARAALRDLVAQAALQEEKLRDIATREWRDEGGRIAAAIARDALARLDGAR